MPFLAEALLADNVGSTTLRIASFEIEGNQSFPRAFQLDDSGFPLTNETFVLNDSWGLRSGEVASVPVRPIRMMEGKGRVVVNRLVLFIHPFGQG